MKKASSITLFVIILFLGQSAMKATPRACDPDAEYNLCGENMHCKVFEEDTGECVCDDGYLPHGRGCKDIDECEEKELRQECKLTGATCQNTPGSFVCQCEPGFEMGESHCEDINECNKNICNENAICKNTKGSYSCECKQGLAGDGVECVLDEVYIQKQKIKQIITIGVAAAGGTLLIILLFACFFCVKKTEKKPATQTMKSAPSEFGRDWDSSGSSEDDSD